MECFCIRLIQVPLWRRDLFGIILSLYVVLSVSYNDSEVDQFSFLDFEMSSNQPGPGQSSEGNVN